MKQHASEIEGWRPQRRKEGCDRRGAALRRRPLFHRSGVGRRRPAVEVMAAMGHLCGQTYSACSAAAALRRRRDAMNDSISDTFLATKPSGISRSHPHRHRIALRMQRCCCAACGAVVTFAARLANFGKQPTAGWPAVAVIVHCSRRPPLLLRKPALAPLAQLPICWLTTRMG